MADVKVNITGQDKLSPAFRTAQDAATDLDKAIQKLAQQDFAERQARTAKASYDKLTESEKQMVLATANYEDAQRKAAAEQSKLNQKHTESLSGLARLKNGLNDVVQSLTGMNLTQLTVAGGLTLLANTVRQSVTEYLSYADAMTKLSMVMGTTVEETSRLVQVADDVRVSQQSIESAMALAVQNGFVPTIENIAKLSDHYLSMSDHIKAAAEMEDIFGKQWKNLLPLLEMGGDAIRANSAAMADGLVITEQEAEQAIKAAEAIDAWNDSITSAKNNLATSVLPALTGLINAFERQQQVVESSGTGWMRYIPILNQVYALVTGIIGAQKGAPDQNISILPQESAVRRSASAVQGLNVRLESGTEFLDRWSAAQNRNAAAQDRLTQSAKFMADVQSQIRAAASEAKAAVDAAQESFDKAYGAKAASSLAKYAGEGEKYRKGLEIQDRVLGTHTAAQYDAEKALDKLSQQFAAGKITAAEYAKGLEAQKPAFEALDDDLAKAKKAFDDVQMSWKNFITGFMEMNGAHISITADIVTSGSSGSGKGSGSGGVGTGSTGTSGRDQSFASGGTPTPYRMAWVGEEGPEPVVFGPGARVLSTRDAMRALAEGAGGGGGGLHIGNITLPGITNPQQFLNYMRQLEKKRIQGGIIHAGR